MRRFLHALKIWWNPGYDCNSQGVIDYLRANGHVAAANDVASLFGR